MKEKQQTFVEPLTVSREQGKALTDIINQLYPEYTVVILLATGQLFLRPTDRKATYIHWYEFCLNVLPLRLYRMTIDTNGIGAIQHKISDAVTMMHPIDYLTQEYTSMKEGVNKRRWIS